ncbi:hypothetical protein Vi05172_g287 [Venturia inaequalis]|uniref:Lccl domain-containing protein n=1 Tax=Venturia inaequalis TaxID=5025 RepID=A0A8H3VF02_VENIN|nr:hypothetical protein EG327_004379 [Venturia inaequalis]RDI89758.1 hypothetical protein Vi05172_g287 [Venturia inaequalis]
MAAPQEKTIRDLNGTWAMNKTLSDDPDAILSLQGVGWIIRKAISMITVTLITKQYEEDGKVHIDIEQPGTAGIKGTSEHRVVEGGWSEHEDHIFGAVKGITTWEKLSELKDSDPDEAFLKQGWSPSTVEKDEVIKSYAESLKNGWNATQIWGFAVVNDEYRYVRNVVVKKGSKTIRARLVYDYKV